MADPDTLLGQAQLQTEQLQAIPKANALRPEATPTQGWPIYVDGASLQIVTYTRITPVFQQFVTVRYMTLNGDIGTIVANANCLNVVTHTVIPFPIESFLLGVEFGGNNSGTALKRGQLYVQAYIDFNGQSIVDSFNGQVQFPVTILIQDYVANSYNPSWPNGRIVASTEGPGYTSSAQIADTTGAEATVTVPTGARWKLKSMSFTNSQGNLQSVGLNITDASGNVIASSIGSIGVMGGTAQSYFGIGLPQNGATTAAAGQSISATQGGLPDMYLEAGWKIVTATNAVAQTLNLTNVYYTYEEWLEP